MTLPDVNVLLAAFRDEHEDHALCRRWLERTLASHSAFGISDLALSAFVRIATNPRALRNPNSLEEALAFAEAVRRPSHAVHLSPGPRHWDIFTRLCLETHVKGTVVADAYYAALAIEHGCELITVDGDFSRFAGLRYRHPLA